MDFKIPIPKGYRPITKIENDNLVVKFKKISDFNKIFQLYTDGGSRGNGNENSIAGIGGAIIYCSEVKHTFSKYLGKGITNNEAEYRALIEGLNMCLSLDFKFIKAHVDSKLVCEQVNNIWKVNNHNLLKLKKEVLELSKQFIYFELVHVLRNDNKIADELANKAMDNLNQ